AGRPRGAARRNRQPVRPRRRGPADRRGNHRGAGRPMTRSFLPVLLPGLAPTAPSPAAGPAGAEMAPPRPARAHVLTVALEDYFQVGAFNRLIQRGQWYRFETRLEPNTNKALDLLDRHGIRATFFVLGWVADKFPELVRRVAERGHEVASK